MIRWETDENAKDRKKKENWNIQEQTIQRTINSILWVIKAFLSHFSFKPFFLYFECHLCINKNNNYVFFGGTAMSQFLKGLSSLHNDYEDGNETESSKKVWK